MDYQQELSGVTNIIINGIAGATLFTGMIFFQKFFKNKK
jgi:hypothetical protein